METPKTVTIPVWDLSEDEIIYMEIEESALEAMDKYQEEIEQRHEEARLEERRLSRYDRD